MRAAVWFEAKQVAATTRMTIPIRGGNVGGMGAHVSKLLAVAVGTFAAARDFPGENEP